MTSLIKLRHQHELLSAGGNEQSALALAWAFQRATEPFRSTNLLARGVLTAIEQDLIYCLTRHQHWIHAPLFTDVLIDFLAREYVLDRQVATGICTAMLAAAKRQPTLKLSHLEATDREFIRYVCVASATAASEADLIVDLGFGSQLLARIKDAVRQLKDDQGIRRFLPEADAHIAEVLCELGRDLKTLPWALQTHRLRYHLHGIDAPWRDLIVEHGVKWIFDLLFAISNRDGLSLRQAEAKLARLLPTAEAAVDVSALLGALAEFHLVYPERQDKWMPLPLAQELTSDAFARNMLNTCTEPMANLATLCGPYQAAVIRALGADLSCEDLQAWLTSQKLVSQPTFIAALSELAERGGIDLAAEVAVRLTNNQASVWQRQSLCESLARFSPTLPIGQHLFGMAKSDPSAAVRMAAMSAARRHGGHGSSGDS